MIDSIYKGQFGKEVAALPETTFTAISNLKSETVNFEGKAVNVLGYYAKGDGGGGLFYWDAASAEADNGGTIIQATAVTTGRWKRVFSGAVNVKWFGAKGDGVTDDTSKIISALASLGTGGGLHFSKGEYDLKDFSIPSNITITANRDAKLSVTGSISISGSEKITLEGVHINSLYAVHIINLTNAKDITILKCYINGNGFIGDSVQTSGAVGGIRGIDCSNVSIKDSEICNFRTGQAILFKSSTDCVVEGNYVHHSGRAGISISSNNNGCKVINNRCHFNVANFTVSDGAIDLYGSYNKNTLIEGNIVTSYGSLTSLAVGIRIKGSHNTKCYNNTVYASTYSFSMFYVQDRDSVIDEYVEISSNTAILEAGSRTFYVLRVVNGKNIIIKNNLVDVQGTLSESVSTAFEFRFNVNNLDFSGNIINASKDPSAISNAVRFHSSGTSYENISITDNKIDVGGIGILASKCKNFTINGNVLKGISSTNDLIHISDSENGFVYHNTINGPNSIIYNAPSNINVIVGERPPIQNTDTPYLTEAAMHADQANQLEG